MEDNCPYCDCVVTSECKALLCESCNKYVPYLCSELPTYSIMLLLKSQRKFICKSCVLAKYQDFPALPGELDTILATQRRKLSSDSTGPTANMNNAVTQLYLIPLIPYTFDMFSYIYSAARPSRSVHR